MAIGAVDDSRDGSLAIVRNVETEVSGSGGCK